MADKIRDSLESERGYEHVDINQCKVSYMNNRLCGYLSKLSKIGPLKVFRRKWVVYIDETCKLLIYNSTASPFPVLEISLYHATFSIPGDNAKNACVFEVQEHSTGVGPALLHTFEASDHGTMLCWLTELQSRRAEYSEQLVNATSQDLGYSTGPQAGMTGGNKTSTAIQSPPSLVQTKEPSTDHRTSGIHQEEKDQTRHSAGSFFKRIRGSTLKSLGNDDCSKCADLEKDVCILKDELDIVGSELEAHRDIVNIMRKEICVLEKQAEARHAGSSPDHVSLLEEKNRSIVELEDTIARLQLEMDEMRDASRSAQSERKSLLADNKMLWETINVKEEMMLSLNNQLMGIEQKMEDSLKRKSQERGGSFKLFEPDTERLMQELLESKETNDNYREQVQFLSSELQRLVKLKQDMQGRLFLYEEKIGEVQAESCRFQAKYLYLAEELRRPVCKIGASLTSTEQGIIRDLLTDAAGREQDGSESPDRSRSQSLVMSHDKYGFQIVSPFSSGGLDTAIILQEKSEQLQSEIVEKTQLESGVAKWERFLLSQPDRPLQRSAELKTLIRAGVPDQFRPMLWTRCCEFWTGHLRERFGNAYYTKLVQGSTMGSLDPIGKQIELDLCRSLPENTHFQDANSPLTEALRRVLCAYAKHNPHVGYCQGMNRLAAIALLFLSEEQSFWCLLAIVDCILPPEYFSNSMIAAIVDQHVFVDLLEEKAPQVASHFRSQKLDVSLYTFPWFLTLFVDGVVSSTFLRIWDTFLYEGSKVLFRFSLAFLKHKQEAILSHEGTSQLNNFMRSLGTQMGNYRKISHIAFGRERNCVNPLPMKRIHVKRQSFYIKVQKELDELDALRKRCSTWRAAEISVPSLQVSVLEDDEDSGQEGEPTDIAPVSSSEAAGPDGAIEPDSAPRDLQGTAEKDANEAAGAAASATTQTERTTTNTAGEQSSSAGDAALTTAESDLSDQSTVGDA